ncbi:MAG TPA: hypothetical protein VGN95_04265 [Pyrinomonadaceae bacterium]|nr:hypothetical protein [Pyrinomonadaceae bacterium]
MKRGDRTIYSSRDGTDLEHSDCLKYLESLGASTVVIGLFGIIVFATTIEEHKAS